MQRRLQNHLRQTFIIQLMIILCISLIGINLFIHIIFAKFISKESVMGWKFKLGFIHLVRIQDLLKNYHFLPLIRKPRLAYQGAKKVSFWENFVKVLNVCIPVF